MLTSTCKTMEGGLLIGLEIKRKKEDSKANDICQSF